MRGQRFWWRFCQASAWLFMLPLFHVRVFGREHVPAGGGALVASNHQSFADPALLVAGLKREASFMARASLFVGLFGRLIHSLNAFPVHRGEADLGAARESLRRLRSGHLLIVFPEGTRSRTGEVGPFRPGLLTLAERADVPIVPAAVYGVLDLWPRGKILPRPGWVWVAYGKPISIDGARDASSAISRREELGKRLREEVVALQRMLESKRRCCRGR